MKRHLHLIALLLLCPCLSMRGQEAEPNLETYVDELIDCLSPTAAPSDLDQDYVALMQELIDLKTPQYVIESFVAWLNGSKLRVGFFGGDKRLWEKVEAVAKEWEKWAAITLEFREANGEFRTAAVGTELNADIRISFDPKGGNRSKLGRTAQRFGKSVRTMNLGDPAKYPNGPRFARVVLHEFGHALGFQHEHQHPTDKCDINMDAAIKHFAKKPNEWSADVTRSQLEAIPMNSGLKLSDRDPESIMHYHLPAVCFESGTKSPCFVKEAQKLSSLDKKGAGLVYPKSQAPGFGGSIVTELEALAGNPSLSKKSRDYVRAELNSISKLSPVP